MLDWLYALDPAAPYLLGAVLVVAAAELGRWLGVRWRRRHAASSSTDVSMLEEGALALLALLVGFTFSMTLTRYDARFNASVDEANAIATTALRARMLPEPHASEVKSLLGDYVRVRVELDRGPAHTAALQRAVYRSNELQKEIWQHAVDASAAEPRSIPVGLFVQTVNEMIDLQSVRVAAARNRVPAPTLLMLYGIAFVVIGFSGYIGGYEARRGHVPVALVGVLFAVVIGMVGDFDRPKTGFVRIGQHALQDLAETLNVTP
jgi:hypothetical protein